MQRAPKNAAWKERGIEVSPSGGCAQIATVDSELSLIYPGHLALPP